MRTKVIIDWFNPCPVLEALKKVGLDTRTFCRDIFEKPIQVLFDELLPYKVKFTRDYNHIRPYADACREIYRRVRDEDSHLEHQWDSVGQ